MKKNLIILCFLTAFVSSYGQGDYHKKKNDYYVEAAAREFDLNEEKKAELSKIRMEMVKAYISSNSSFKSGDISEDEMKKNNKKASENFHRELSKLTGKTYKEMKPWLDKMRIEMKKI